MFGLFKTKCPKCGGTEITVVKESLISQLIRYTMYLAFFVLILFIRKRPDLYVCKACGFSWEKR